MAKIKIEVDVETLTQEQLNALILLIGVSHLLKVKEGDVEKPQPVQTVAPEQIAAEPANALGEKTVPATATSVAPPNPFGEKATEQVPSAPANPFGAKTAPATDTSVAPPNPFGAKTAATAPTSATPPNPFGAKAAASTQALPKPPTAPAAPSNPFGAKVAQTAPQTPPATAVAPANPFGAAKEPVKEEASARVEFSVDGSMFTFDGVLITASALRMAVGQLTFFPEKMQQINAKLNTMGYNNIIECLDSWNSTGDARDAATIYEFTRSLA